MIHYSAPNEFLWQYYYGDHDYEGIVHPDDPIRPIDDKNIYVWSSYIHNFENRAITISNFDDNKVLIAFCYFKHCSSQNPDGGGTIFAEFCKVVLYFCCAVGSESQNYGVFSKFEQLNKNYPLTFETCTISSCGSETSTAEDTIHTEYTDSIIFLSTNFSYNKYEHNRLINSQTSTTSSLDAYFKFKFCSFIGNIVQNGVIYIFYSHCSYSHCNMIQNSAKSDLGSLILLERSKSQIYHSCFRENEANTEIYCSYGKLYIINCSFDKGRNGIKSSEATVLTDEIGDSQFSLLLGHLSYEECEAPLEKRPYLNYNNNNNKNNENINNNNRVVMHCSCQAFLWFSRLPLSIVPALYLPTMAG